jgi:hypothetical protein
MAAPKGTRPPAAGKGRPKGAKNKLTADVKAAILAAFDELGGVAYLVQQGRDNPQAFLSLLSKVLPKDVSVSVVTDYADLVLEAARRRTAQSALTIN